MRRDREPLADMLGDLILKLLPKDFVWAADARTAFNRLYNKLSELDERQLPRR